MQDLGEVLVNTVAALAATSLCHFGVTLKETPKRPNAEAAVVRRLRQPVKPKPVIAMRSRDGVPCPKDDRI